MFQIYAPMFLCIIHKEELFRKNKFNLMEKEFKSFLKTLRFNQISYVLILEKKE